MAATPSKPSPTSKPVQQSDTTVVENGGVGVDPPGERTKEMAQHVTTAYCTPPNDTFHEDLPAAVYQLQPTYESSEQSDYYLTAKQLLNDGDFEQALVTIQEGLETTKTFLETATAGGNGTADKAVVDLHESLAPLHYLYGTTLLYSVEESTDSQQMTVGQNTAGPDAAAADSSVEPSEADQQGASDDRGIEFYADDMQIAWENLDAARTIVELLLSNDDDGSMPYARRTRLQIGLAQTLLREGDLQRLNGRYTEAIQDYTACLKFRQKLMQQDPFNRQIADVHYNLGMTYLTSSSELKKQHSMDGEGGDQPNGSAQATMGTVNRDKLSEEHRVHGIHHYLECAKVFCGRIALACCADPREIITGIRIDADGVQRAGLKTTGLDDDHRETKSTSRESRELSAMRRRVAALTPLKAGDSGISDLRQFLDEIQETVDEAAISQEAVRQASELKVKAQEAVAQAGPITDISGVTTSIGFGTATIPSLEKSEGTNMTKPAAKPMMVIKKKKKRDSEETEGFSTDVGVSDAKRTKAE